MKIKDEIFSGWLWTRWIFCEFFRSSELRYFFNFQLGIYLHYVKCGYVLVRKHLHLRNRYFLLIVQAGVCSVNRGLILIRLCYFTMYYYYFISTACYAKHNRIFSGYFYNNNKPTFSTCWSEYYYQMYEGIVKLSKNNKNVNNDNNKNNNNNNRFF